MEQDPWFNTWGDLEAMGIMVTPSQQRTVESGGLVLALAFYPEPGSPYLYGQEMPAFDQFGNQIFVPVVIDSVPTGDECPVSFNRPSGIVTLGDWFDNEVDEHWRFWPSYTGEATDYLDRLWWMCDIPQVIRVWDGIPLADFGDPGGKSEASVSHRLIRAAEQRIAVSAHDGIDILYGLEEEGDFPSDESEWEEVESGRNDQWDDLYRLLRALQEDGYWDMSNRQLTEKLIEYEPMEHLLADDPQALGLWTGLVEQSRVNTLLSQALIPAPKRAYYNHKENEFTPWS